MARSGQFWQLRRRAGAGTPVSPPPDGEPDPGDDLTTWPYFGVIRTMTLPGTPPIEGEDGGLVPQDTPPYFLIFDVTAVLPQAARDATYSLRFTDGRGVKLGHLRTSTNRIIVGGTFYAGLPIDLTYYYGKSGTTQPGGGFPSSSQLLSPMLLMLLFENGAPVDYSGTPAAFTVTGTPTFVAGSFGQAMQCGDGSYISTTAAKLRGNTRGYRHAFALINMSSAETQARVFCWANWLNADRAWQLWGDSSKVENYVSENGTNWYAWRTSQGLIAGRNFLGTSWLGGSGTAIVQRNELVESITQTISPAPPAQLFNAVTPFIVGGSPVPGFFCGASIDAGMMFHASLIPAQMQALDMAWRENLAFLGQDRTPNPFTIPSLSSQERSTEVSFAPVQVTGISDATPISIAGEGNPTFAISSSSTVTGDVRAKGPGSATINHGQWVRVWVTTSANYVAGTTAYLTVGTASVPATASTKTEPGTGGGSGIPEGTATYTVTSLSALHDVVNNQLQDGQIVQIAAGDYSAQGELTIRNKSWGPNKAVIRASTHAYRGPHPSQEGLFVAGEGSFTTGSGGAEFSGLRMENVSNLVLEGIRIYLGNIGGSWNYIGSYNNGCVFRYCKFAGHKASGYLSGWIGGTSGYTWGSDNVPGGFALKEASNNLFQKCLFHYVVRGLWIIGANPRFEECVFSDTGGDLVYMAHANSGMTMHKCVIFRTWPSSSAFHCDALQCTAKDDNASTNQLYSYMLQGPGNSWYPHIQGAFLEQDNSAFNGPDGVVIEDSVFENRTQNALYMRPAKNCIARRVTMIQNQFGGADTNNRNTLIHAPQINFNANNTSRGGNRVESSIYHTLGLGGSDTVTGSYQLTSSGYATHLEDYPVYSSGIWRPCMFLNNNACVDAAELRRMAPKTSSPYHPNNAANLDVGGWRVFEYYGALP